MLNVIKQCVSWLDWKFVAGVLAALVLFAVCAKLPTLGMFAGVAPILLIAVCLVPCLVPLVWLRNTRRGAAAQTHEQEDDSKGYIAHK
jgi:hypothetical protein